MKFSLVFSLLCFVVGSSVASPQKNEGTLFVKINKIRNTDGNLKIALVDKETKVETKKDLEHAIKVDKLSISGKSIDYKITKLPYGKYSFVVFHDENNNDKLDLDLFDIPLEGFGYSNNPKVKNRRPTFKESAFEIKQKELTIVVEMKYF